MTAFTPRRAARVLLVDDAGRLLLLHGTDPARPGYDYWMTPGGGLDAGESPAAGAARELAEETGLVVEPAALGQAVWRQVTEFPFDGRWYRQQQEFFLLRVPFWEVDTAGFDDVERVSVVGHRWWTVEELDATDENVFPRELTTVLSAALEGEYTC